jgi:hypothetical protein
VDFALALKRFDLLAMQPHFPGYPYFILGASVVHNWVANPVQALTVFNIGMAFSSVFPITLLARRYVGTAWGLLLAGLILTTPYLWLMAARPMSECAGIAALWWFLWSTREAMGQKKPIIWHGLALFFFSILMGIRLSFFPFGLALLLLWKEQYIDTTDTGRRGRRRRLVLSMFAAALFQFIWIGGLAMSEGSLSGFWKLSLAFVEGHFSEWGGGVAATQMPFGERLLQLLGNNLAWQAMLGRSILNGILLSLLAVAAGIHLWRLKFHGKTSERRSSECAADQSDRIFLIWLLMCIIVYGLWALFGQNIEKPRHIAPIVGPFLLLITMAAIRSAVQLGGSPRLPRYIKTNVPPLIFIIVIALLLGQLWVGTKLLKEQAEQLPAVYQLHDYLSSVREPFVLYTWEETRVLQHLQTDYEHKRIYTYAYFQSTAGINAGHKIFITDHVLEGFERQGINLGNHVKRVAEFTSNSLFDPVYHDIILYEYFLDKH